MKASIARYLNNARAGYTFVFDDGCYYDSTVKSVEIFKSVEARTGVKIKATSAQTVGFLHERLIELWKELFAEGYYDLASHSMDHGLCFNEETPWERREGDAIESKKALEKIYGITPLCYVAPNGGHTPEGCRALHEHYIANRNNSEGGVDPYEMDMYNIGVFIPNHAHTDVTPYADFANELIEKGQYAIQINHWLSEKEQDTFHAQRLEVFEMQCNHFADLALEGKLWVASMNDAVKYFYERKNAQIEIQGDKITVKHTLDRSVFDMPLTIVVESDEDKTIEVNGTPFEIKAGKESIITVEV